MKSSNKTMSKNNKSGNKKMKISSKSKIITSSIVNLDLNDSSNYSSLTNNQQDNNCANSINNNNNKNNNNVNMDFINSLNENLLQVQFLQVIFSIFFVYFKI